MSLPTMPEFIEGTKITLAFVGGLAGIGITVAIVMEVLEHRHEARVIAREERIAKRKRMARNKRIAKQMKDLQK
ncbi:hypothetical protein UT300003_32150 [Clostridium sardiniense]